MSRVLCLSQSATSRVVDRLELDGLIERRRGADGRTVLLFPTDKGKQQIREILSHRQATLESILSILSTKQQTQLLALLEKILANLPHDQEQARNICRFCDEVVCHRDGCPVGRAVAETD